MEFKVVNKYLQEQNKTFVAIRCQDPYTAYDRILEGNHMAETDETLIQAVKKMVQIENDPSGAMSSMQQLIDLTSQKTNENETIVKRMDKLQAIFIEYTIANGHMPIKTYQEISALLPELKPKKRYLTNDIVQATYPYDTNPKYPQGSPIILKFIDNFNYNNEGVQALLQRGAVSIVMPQFEEVSE